VKAIPRTLLLGLIEPVVFGSLIFLGAGTFHYWQAWVFLVVFNFTTSIPSTYLLRTNPNAVQRRIRGGPAAEQRIAQKVVVSCWYVTLASTLVVSALGHRFGWAPVPTAICFVGDALVAIGLSAVMLVVIQNSYAAATVRVESGQKVVSTGLYGLVRHPMYAGNLIIMVGIPLALGSYWGLVFLIPGMIVFAFRIHDEEKLLEEELNGYREYTQRIRYRLVPYIW
jgi:protein-S-isoprenylcysteine O-methyltransferase Ste14